jgi:hypothetical protein
LSSTNGNDWNGVIRADTRPGPQTVYLIAKDASGGLAGQIGLYNVSTSGPPLSIQVLNNSVTISWPNVEGPFNLQMKTNLADSAWTDVLITFATSLNYPLTSQAAFYRLQVLTIPDDPTDYQADRPAVAQFYSADPQSYWVHFGIPPLARLSTLLQDGGNNPTNAFEGLMLGFNEPMFSSALEGGQLPQEFSNHVAGFEMAGQPPGVALINTFRGYVGELDTVLAQQGTNAPRVLQIYQLFNDVFPHAFQTNGLAPLVPQPSKVFIQPVVTNHINWVDLHYSDTFTTNIPPIVTPPDNTNTTTHTPWAKITNSIWNTTYNGACAAVATGASLAKCDPGRFPADTTCQFWNDFSCLLGTGNVTTHVGAYQSGIAAFYASFGYSCEEAYSGYFESAAEEAKKALDRGCDVTITYVSADGKNAHVEMVEAITLDPGNSEHATVHTLSWGHHPSVDVNNGTFSGKTDGTSTYGAGSWLAGTGKATFRYYCKK